VRKIKTDWLNEVMNEQFLVILTAHQHVTTIQWHENIKVANNSNKYQLLRINPRDDIVL